MGITDALINPGASDAAARAIAGELLVSADSHIMEPSDLWRERLPAHLRDKAPYSERGNRHRDIPADPEYFQYPMLKRVVERSLGVIVHNPRAAAMAVQHAPSAVVYEIPHLFTAPVESPAAVPAGAAPQLPACSPRGVARSGGVSQRRPGTSAPRRSASGSPAIPSASRAPERR